jgi:hypothetical protein
MNAQDTWTLKIKHTPKPFRLQRNKGCVCYNDEVPVVYKSSKNNKDAWQQITDASESDAEDADAPIFNKFRRSARSKRRKSRRKSSSNVHVNREENATITSLNETTIQPVLQEPPILKQMAQMDQELRVAFNRLGNETSEAVNSDEAFQELNESQWENVAAVLLDSVTSHNPASDEILNQQTNRKEINSTDSSVDQELRQLTQPSEWSEDGNGPQADKEIISLDDARENKILHARNYNKEARNRTDEEGSNDEEENWRKSTESVEVEAKSNGEQSPDIDEYVIEDPTVREYDKVDVEVEDYYDTMGDGRGDSEPTSEMRRIMDLFPRSKLLTTENNGYKLFPGVSSLDESSTK